MNKTEFISFLTSHFDCPKKQAAESLELVLDGILAAIKTTDEINLIGFGKFTKRFRPAQTGRNPKNGDAITIDAYYQPIFKSGQKMKDAVNE